MSKQKLKEIPRYEPAMIKQYKHNYSELWKFFILCVLNTIVIMVGLVAYDVNNWDSGIVIFGALIFSITGVIVFANETEPRYKVVEKKVWIKMGDDDENDDDD